MLFCKHKAFSKSKKFHSLWREGTLKDFRQISHQSTTAITDSSTHINETQAYSNSNIRIKFQITSRRGNPLIKNDLGGAFGVDVGRKR
ncbi:hypothetical protein ACOSQ2_014595 [Xanthoceras sorbifolium]